MTIIRLLLVSLQVTHFYANSNVDTIHVGIHVLNKGYAKQRNKDKGFQANASITTYPQMRIDLLLYLGITNDTRCISF